MYVCVQTLNIPPCVWLQVCAGISVGEFVWMCARVSTSVCIHVCAYKCVSACYVQHLADLRQKCVGTSGRAFHFTSSMAVRPSQTPPERRGNPPLPAVPHTLLYATVPARSTVWGTWENLCFHKKFKKFNFYPVHKYFSTFFPCCTKPNGLRS